MRKNWQPKALAELGDLIGFNILLICEDGAFDGGLKSVTDTEIHIETSEGTVLAISRDVLKSDLTELFTLEVI